MMSAKSLFLMAVLFVPIAVPAQQLEVPAVPGETARKPIVWGPMNAFDLSQARLRTGQPVVTFDAAYPGQRERGQQAQLDRFRTRVAERLRDTQQAATGQPPSSTGSGRPGGKAVTGAE